MNHSRGEKKDRGNNSFKWNEILSKKRKKKSHRESEVLLTLGHWWLLRYKKILISLIYECINNLKISYKLLIWISFCHKLKWFQ